VPGSANRALTKEQDQAWVIRSKQGYQRSAGRTWPFLRGAIELPRRSVGQVCHMRQLSATGYRFAAWSGVHRRGTAFGRIAGDTTDGAGIGMGSGLALIDTTVGGAVEQIGVLRQVVGNVELARSACGVVGLEEGINGEFLMNLVHAQVSDWGADDNIVIRKRDRRGAWSPAIRAAPAFALLSIRYVRTAAMVDAERPVPPVPRRFPIIVGESLRFTFGVAHPTTQTFIHMAASDGRDSDEVLAVYRAMTVGRPAVPPGDLPLTWHDR
jgi:hypothetical protein